MHLASFLTPDAVIPHLPARDKKQALKKLAAEAAARVHLSEREIFQVIQHREQRGCTGMGSGVCIPHGRFEELPGIHALFARLDVPIDFEAPDGRKVDLIFLLLSPSAANTEHIKALSLISRLLRDKELTASLRKAPDAASMYKLLVEAAAKDAA